MKITLLLLVLIFGINFSYSQIDRLQADGTFRYEAKLYLENPAVDFAKTDILDYINSMDVISADDLAILMAKITSVFKTFPSQDSSNTITIIATSEIYSILDSLNNSIESQHCVGSECGVWTDGSFKYNAVLNIDIVPNDFDKDAFFDYITALDNISSNDLSTLQNAITSVYKSYPTAHTPFLKKIVTIESSIEIFSTLDGLNNSFEHYNCEPEPIPLGINENIKNRKSIVFPNPITENSIIKLDANYENVRIEIVNSFGQIMYQEKNSGNNSIELKNIPIGNGIYFLKISDLINGTEEIIKIVKQ